MLTIEEVKQYLHLDSDAEDDYLRILIILAGEMCENYTRLAMPDELPESYVIFITRDDILGYGLPIYHIDRQIKELNEAFQDEAHIIYVNSKKQDDTQLGRLMHDLHCKKADEMHSPILAKRVYELKETQKGVELMCHEMEKIYSEGMESGEKRGIEMGELKAKKETILSLAEMGIPVDKIAKAVNLSEKDVQKWIDETLCVTK